MVARSFEDSLEVDEGRIVGAVSNLVVLVVETTENHTQGSRTGVRETTSTREDELTVSFPIVYFQAFPTVS